MIDLLDQNDDLAETSWWMQQRLVKLESALRAIQKLIDTEKPEEALRIIQRVLNACE
jgi:hypothetical protein